MAFLFLLFFYFTFPAGSKHFSIVESLYSRYFMNIFFLLVRSIPSRLIFFSIIFLQYSTMFEFTCGFVAFLINCSIPTFLIGCRKWLWTWSRVLMLIKSFVVCTFHFVFTCAKFMLHRGPNRRKAQHEFWLEKKCTFLVFFHYKNVSRFQFKIAIEYKILTLCLAVDFQFKIEPKKI